MVQLPVVTDLMVSIEEVWSDTMTSGGVLVGVVLTGRVMVLDFVGKADVGKEGSLESLSSSSSSDAKSLVPSIRKYNELLRR